MPAMVSAPTGPVVSPTLPITMVGPVPEQPAAAPAVCEAAPPGVAARVDPLEDVAPDPLAAPAAAVVVPGSFVAPPVAPAAVPVAAWSAAAVPDPLVDAALLLAALVAFASDTSLARLSRLPHPAAMTL